MKFFYLAESVQRPGTAGQIQLFHGKLICDSSNREIEIKNLINANQYGIIALSNKTDSFL